MDRTKNVIEARKLRTAVIGCGRISRNHFAAIDEHVADLELAAVCDVEESALSNITFSKDVQLYTSFEKLLENEKIDLVVLCTPSGIHAQQANWAAKYNVLLLQKNPCRLSIHMVCQC